MAGTRLILVAAAAALALSACDNGPSAVAQKQAAGTQMAAIAPEESYATAPRAGSAASRVDHRNDPVKLVDGKPMWSASRRYSAQQNALVQGPDAPRKLGRACRPSGPTRQTRGPVFSLRSCTALTGDW